MQYHTSDPLPGSKIYFHTPSLFAKENFLYPLCLGHFLCDNSYFVSRNSYDSYLLMYVKEGRGYFYSNETKISICPGQAVLLDCYKPHAYGADSSLDFYWVHFDGISAAGYAKALIPHIPLPFSLHSSQRLDIDQIFSILINGIAKGTLSELQLAKYLTDLLTLLSMADRSVSDVDANDIRYICQKASAFMRQNLARPLTLNDIAAHAGLSPYYFVRCFKQQNGVTPHQYLLNLRLDSARFYLGTTTKTIREITFLCGFQSENNFCIAFKKQMHMTPTMYREKVSR